LGREIEERFDEDNMLKIAASFYSPARGLRTVNHVRESSWSRLRRVESGHLALERALPHHFGLTMFGNLEVFFVPLSLLSCCFVILIKYSRAQKGTQASYPCHYHFLLL